MFLWLLANCTGGIYIRTYVYVVQIEVYCTHTPKMQHNVHWFGG